MSKRSYSPEFRLHVVLEALQSELGNTDLPVPEQELSVGLVLSARLCQLESRNWSFEPDYFKTRPPSKGVGRPFL